MSANFIVEFERLIEAIHRGEEKLVSEVVTKMPTLLTATSHFAKHFESPTNHWLYIGDTALHMAAASNSVEIAGFLISNGSNPNSAANHRNGTPLHYAADGYVGDPSWDPDRQIATISLLLRAGADLHAADKNGATALHRAVRTRCSAAVKLLLDAGSNPLSRNKSGSTPFHLAVQNTGRGGSGGERAIAEQREVIEAFLSRNISVETRGAKGATVRDSATANWVKVLLKG